MNKNKSSIQVTKLGNKIEQGKGQKSSKKAKKSGTPSKSDGAPVGHKETIRFFFGLVGVGSADSCAFHAACLHLLLVHGRRRPVPYRARRNGRLPKLCRYGRGLLCELLVQPLLWFFGIPHSGVPCHRRHEAHPCL